MYTGYIYLTLDTSNFIEEIACELDDNDDMPLSLKLEDALISATLKNNALTDALTNLSDSWKCQGECLWDVRRRTLKMAKKLSWHYKNAVIHYSVINDDIEYDIIDNYPYPDIISNRVYKGEYSNLEHKKDFDYWHTLW
jgi:hypothetical protein